MTRAKQIETIEELAELILKDNPHIKMGSIRRGVFDNHYTEFNGVGNVWEGFKNISISIISDSILLRLDLDPNPRYDHFNPNPHFSFFEALNIDKAKNIVKEMLKFSDNLKSGLGKLILKEGLN